ncbi:hypothetical protein AOQ84DRAFT_205620 [Glonium stellatum]|uniref:Uncharacterized protein n=1 Tax=Glonium stellatum TaxID=574774 RepID=A0A8E2F5Z8_9PEZI|nr:hypothetical protein AOQ84DRAFT_205620 [Glonium stellatum]
MILLVCSTLFLIGSQRQRKRFLYTCPELYFFICCVQAFALHSAGSLFFALRTSRWQPSSSWVNARGFYTLHHTLFAFFGVLSQYPRDG